jgi:uncharacterized membrane protein YfcA
VGAGLVSGLLGVGGGLINTPILHLLLGVPFERAVATSAYMIGVTAASGALVYLARGDVEPGIAAATVLGTLIGAAAAARMAHRVDQAKLRVGFAVVLLYVAYRMIRRGLAGL